MLQPGLMMDRPLLISDVIEHGAAQFGDVEVVSRETHGPLFRYERPQKGRFRQFHQLDAEVIGAAEPAADIELLCFADQLLKELGISEGVTLQLNTLGDAGSREAWRAELIAHFEAHRADLSEDSLERLHKNPLRILDSKDPRDRPAADSAPDIDTFLTDEARDFFDTVTAGLDAAGVAWTRASRLVRGLDYYRHTAFEFVTDRLGAQGTVLGGGRYDGLIEALGGPHTPAVGWAAGIERLGMLLESQPIKVPVVAVIPTEAGLEDKALAVTAALRRAGVATEMALRGNAKRRAEIARKEGALSILYVRQAGDPMGEYYFSYSGKDDQERNRVARQVSDAIGSTFLLSGIDA